MLSIMCMIDDCTSSLHSGKKEILQFVHFRKKPISDISQIAFVYYFAISRKIKMFRVSPVLRRFLR